MASATASLTHSVIVSRSLRKSSRFSIEQVVVDAAGNGAGAMHLLAGGGLDDLLAVFAHHHGAATEFGILLQNLEDVALGRRRVEAEQEVRRGQMEEVQDMALQDLAVMHQATHLLGGRRQRVDADDHVHRLGGGQMVAHRADAAQALHHDGDFPHQATADEPFEAAEFDDVQPRFLDLVLLVHVDGDLAVSFDTGHRGNFDQSGLGHFSCPSRT